MEWKSVKATEHKEALSVVESPSTHYLWNQKNLMEKQQRQTKLLFFPSYLLYVTITTEILGEMEFWSQPLQLYLPLNK